MTLTPQERREALAPFRARIFRYSLRAGWLLLALTLFAAYRAGVDLLQPRFIGPSLALAVSWALLHLVDWERHTRLASGEWLLAMATAALVTSMAIISTIPAMHQLIFVLYFGVVAVTAALAGRGMQIAITLTIVMLNAVLPPAFGNGIPTEEIVLQSASLILVAVLTSAVASQFRRETYAGVSRIAAIRSREEDLSRLYDVSRTLAAGRSLEEVLPLLVGKIGRYMDARIGAILLHDASDAALEVLGPVWTSGEPLDIGVYQIPLRVDSPLVTVFLSNQPALVEDTDPKAGDLVSDLGIRQALVVPLRIEHRTIGVMVVGDKRNGRFTESDLGVLESLAGPAALVVSQLERFALAEESSRKMEELATMKTDFVSVVSHELRTPLTSIIGSLATIARPELAPESPAARELLASARKQSDRLRRLIEDLLMVSRLDNAGLPQHPQPVDLGGFLRETVGAIPEAGDIITVEGPEDLTIEVDPDHLSRVLRNLIENALKYAPGSPIEITATEHLGNVVISIVDHGPGIPADKREKAFEPFSQLDPADTRSQGGTGLGLSIVRSLVEQMGGSIELASTEGGGATFKITLPVQPRITKPLAV